MFSNQKNDIFIFVQKCNKTTKNTKKKVTFSILNENAKKKLTVSNIEKNKNRHNIVLPVDKNIHTHVHFYTKYIFIYLILHFSNDFCKNYQK